MSLEIRHSTSKALLVLAFCLLTTAFSRGAGESFSVFLLPLSAHFQWERAAVASIYSVYMVALGVGSLLAGLTFDNFGARFNYLFGFGLLALAYGIAGSLDSLWQFYLVLGVCCGVGAAMAGVVPSQSLISRWFDRRLSTALSFGNAGQGLGTLCMVPIAQLTLDRMGWSSTYTAAGVLFALIWILIAVLPWKTISIGAAENPRKTQSGKAVSGLSLREALKTRAFWGFFCIFFFTATGVFGISLQTVAYLVEQGFSEVESALAFGVVGMLAFAGMTLTGIAADFWPRHLVATASYTLSFIGIVSLALVQWNQSWLPVGIFVLAFGLSAGARGPIVATLMAKNFTGKGLASIYGAANIGQGIGAATGTLGAALLYDVTGAYNTGFVICTVALFLGASMFWLIPEIRNAPR